MDFETIPARELNRYVREGRGIIVDLRDREEYRESHIRGAVNMPYEEMEGNYEFPRGQEIVLYCDRGSVSMAVARELAARNYRVKTVVGGIRAYRGPYLVRIGSEKQV